jgi:opacity protein-like surface antigen
MNTTTPIFQSKKGALIAALLVALFSSVSAQSYKHKVKNFQSRSSNYSLIGATVSLGTNGYKFKSDIASLSGLKVMGDGWTTELILGNSQIKIRGGFGKYNFDKSSNESINQTLFTGKLNVSPNALFGQSKFVRLYLLTGFDYNVFSLKGISIPQPIVDLEDEAAKRGKGKKKCSCGLTSGDPGAPGPGTDAVEDVTPTENSAEAPDAKIKKGQINGGLGLEINIARKGTFLRLYGEGYYGIPMSEIIDNIGLSKTKISPQLMINFGVGIGLWK